MTASTMQRDAAIDAAFTYAVNSTIESIDLIRQYFEINPLTDPQFQQHVQNIFGTDIWWKYRAWYVGKNGDVAA